MNKKCYIFFTVKQMFFLKLYTPSLFFFKDGTPQPAVKKYTKMIKCRNYE